MSVKGRRTVSIELSRAQVEEVVRAASRLKAPTVVRLAARTNGAGAAGLVANGVGEDADDDRRLSRSLVRGLSVLASFQADTRDRGIVELAGELGLSPSTTHRYASTLVEIGLLERCPRTRKYRIAGS